MTRTEAKKQLNIGYILFGLGLFVGAFIPKYTDNQINNDLMLGYVFWSTYWGYRIIYSKLNSINNPAVHLETKTITDYFSKVFLMNCIVEFYKLLICCIVGFLGGGIVKQIQLSKSAYFK